MQAQAAGQLSPSPGTHAASGATCKVLQQRPYCSCPTHPPSAAEANQPAVEQLQEQVAKLKGARDRLLAQLDSQSAELDRLAAENAALTQASAGCRHARVWPE